MIRTANILQGKRVRLTAVQSPDLAAMVAWYEDAGFLRLFDAIPAYPKTEAALREQMEEQQKRQNGFVFAVRLLEDDRLIGYVELDGILWAHRVAWLGIGIGDRADWGHGYGQEAMEIALDWAFSEINLHRVQLTVFDYNEQAIALYERLGFRQEGAFREFLQRDGQRHDMLLYGLLRSEWTAGRRP